MSERRQPRGVAVSSRAGIRARAADVNGATRVHAKGVPCAEVVPGPGPGVKAAGGPDADRCGTPHPLLRIEARA